jgi:membrane-bound acyltransferase YfiQ involved in biofilm formation
MWERLNKVQIQNVVTIIIVLTCSWLVISGKYKAEHKELINKYFDLSLAVVLGWLFTFNKKNNA